MEGHHIEESQLPMLGEVNVKGMLDPGDGGVQRQRTAQHVVILNKLLIQLS
jgi:hypothetical protein